jgi:hypothetical protein
LGVQRRRPRAGDDDLYHKVVGPRTPPARSSTAGLVCCSTLLDGSRQSPRPACSARDAASSWSRRLHCRRRRSAPDRAQLRTLGPCARRTSTTTGSSPPVPERDRAVACSPMSPTHVERAALPALTQAPSQADSRATVTAPRGCRRRALPSVLPRLPQTSWLDALACDRSAKRRSASGRDRRGTDRATTAVLVAPSDDDASATNRHPRRACRAPLHGSSPKHNLTSVQRPWCSAAGPRSRPSLRSL